MPLNIKDRETYDLARELAAVTGESMTGAVKMAIRERLQRVRARRLGERGRLARRLDEIALHCSRLPVLRDRTESEILGYNDRGLPD